MGACAAGMPDSRTWEMDAAQAARGAQEWAQAHAANGRGIGAGAHAQARPAQAGPIGAGASDFDTQAGMGHRGRARSQR